MKQFQYAQSGKVPHICWWNIQVCVCHTVWVFIDRSKTTKIMWSFTSSHVEHINLTDELRRIISDISWDHWLFQISQRHTRLDYCKSLLAVLPCHMTSEAGTFLLCCKGLRPFRHPQIGQTSHPRPSTPLCYCQTAQNCLSSTWMIFVKYRMFLQMTQIFLVAGMTCSTHWKWSQVKLTN